MSRPGRARPAFQTLLTGALAVLLLGSCGEGAEQKAAVAPPASGVSAEAPVTVRTEAPSGPTPTNPESVEVYSFDLPKAYPIAAATWRANLPPEFQTLNWAADFEGVGTPLRIVTLNGAPAVFGFLCEAHNCGNNNIGVLMTSDQRRVVGFVQMTDDQTGGVSITPVGRPTRVEQACLMRLNSDDGLVKC